MSTSPALAIGPGSVLGRYQVISHLATGGMAEIYLARATGLEGFERYVVVKCIRPEYAREAQFVAMFIDEARLSAQLHHANIAQVYDIGHDGGAYYFAMEYVHGRNLREVLLKVAQRGEALPLPAALTIVAGAAAGLHYAHDKRGSDRAPLGIVHRDVSPSNVLVAYDGLVKVVDFGIAKAAARMTETRSGTLKGKVSYMSPEQCSGQPVDRRSDVFALGILLYELTTMERLFAGENDYMTMHRIATGEFEPPSARRPGYPDALETIVLTALANRPDDRYPTVAALLDALVEFARGASIALSTIELARAMRDWFGDCPEPWLAVDGRRDSNRGLALSSTLPASSGAASTATGTHGAAPSGLTALPNTIVDPTEAGSQVSALLSAEVEAKPAVRPRRGPMWVGSALLGAAVLGGGLWLVVNGGERADTPSPGRPEAAVQPTGPGAPEWSITAAPDAGTAERAESGSAVGIREPIQVLPGGLDAGAPMPPAEAPRSSERPRPAAGGGRRRSSSSGGLAPTSNPPAAPRVEISPSPPRDAGASSGQRLPPPPGDGVKPRSRDDLRPPTE